MACYRYYFLIFVQGRCATFVKLIGRSTSVFFEEHSNLDQSHLLGHWPSFSILCGDMSREERSKVACDWRKKPIFLRTSTLQNVSKLSCWKSACGCGAEDVSKSTSYILWLWVRSTCRSQHVKSILAAEHLWKLSGWKCARGCGTKHVLKSQCQKHLNIGALFEVVLYSQKVHAAVARSTCRSQTVNDAACCGHFKMSKRDFWWQAQWILHLAKSEPNVRVCSRFKKSKSRRGMFEGDLPGCILCGRHSTRDTSSRYVRRSGPGRWFPEMGCILEHPLL